MISDIVPADAFRPKFLAQFGLRAAIYVPRSFASDPGKTYHISCIEVPVEMQDTLDCEGKLNRSAGNSDWVIAQDEAAAERFLNERAKVAADSGLPRAARSRR